MNTTPRIPDDETRAKSVRNMQEFCRQLEIATLMLDEAIAIADQNLRTQRLDRLQKRTFLTDTPEKSGVPVRNTVGVSYDSE
jgi:hypothetical protein